REVELSLLQSRLEATRDGRGGVAFIIGEPGLGKSRLLFELRKWTAGRGWLASAAAAGLRWHEGRSLSYGNQPLAPVLQMLRGLLDLGAAPGDDQALF